MKITFKNFYGFLLISDQQIIEKSFVFVLMFFATTTQICIFNKKYVKDNEPKNHEMRKISLIRYFKSPIEYTLFGNKGFSVS